MPIFFLPGNYWDAATLEYGFVKENLSGIEIWYREAGSYFQLVLLNLIFLLYKFTFLSHDFLFDLLTVLSLILFCYEIKKYAKTVFEFDNYLGNLCAIFIISFPVWHTLVAFNLGLYLICFYLALLGYRLLISKKLLISLIGIIIILFSFSIKSNFSFIIGLSLAHNFRLFSNSQSIKKYSLSIIIILCSSSYFINAHFFPPFGMLEGYNLVELEKITFINLITDLRNFLTFFIFYLWVPILYLLILKLKKKHILLSNLFRKKDLIDYFIISIIFFTSIFPYMLANRSTDLFFISDYNGRHAYLLSMSFGLFFTVILKKINELYSLKKVPFLILFIFIFQNLFILGGGYYTKIETAIFKNDFVSKLKKIEEPPGGSIQVLNSQIPGYFRKAEGNYLFFKAYGKASWWVNYFDQKEKKNFKTPEFILNRSDYKTKYVLDDFKQKCSTIIKLENEINKIDRIYKFYIFNSKEYFKINVLSSNC